MRDSPSDGPRVKAEVEQIRNGHPARRRAEQTPPRAIDGRSRRPCQRLLSGTESYSLAPCTHGERVGVRGVASKAAPEQNNSKRRPSPRPSPRNTKERGPDV